MKKLAVYFSNNNKTVFDLDRVEIITNSQVRSNGDLIVSDAADGLCVVNWDNVCYIKAIEERSNDE